MSASNDHCSPPLETTILSCRAALEHHDGESDGKERSNIMKKLADALMEDHSGSHSVTGIEEAIVIYDEILGLRPVGHEHRAEATGDLGNALFFFCIHHEMDPARSIRCLELTREALSLHPFGHPTRHQALHNLARALAWISYEHQAGGMDALTESIDLNREALLSRPIGHPERDKSLASLAFALMRAFYHCGDLDFLAEAIESQRQTLQVQQPGHPLRDRALHNLAVLLVVNFEYQGGLDSLSEAISFQREAMELRPAGHVDRYTVLDSLAQALATSFQLQGRTEALAEAILLDKEALQLLPTGHPQRGRILANLGAILMLDFEQRRRFPVLSEAIATLREAQNLLPPGSFSRDAALNNLAEALLLSFNEHKDRAHLLEAIAIHRDILMVRSPGHWRRLLSLRRLGNLLCIFESQSWVEALALFREALDICVPGYPARAELLSDMTKCFLTPESPFFDLSQGIAQLFECYSDNFSHVNLRLGLAVSDLPRLEAAFKETTVGAHASTRVDHSSRILELYELAIGLLPRAAHLGVDHKNRLQAVAGCDEMARSAASRALLLGRMPKAMEMLEEGRGTFWSQTLRLRATGLDGVPDGDRQELERLFRLLELGARRVETSNLSAAQRERDLEARRRLNEEAEALIVTIRGYPGLDRFLLPPVFATLLDALPDGFVVVVNISKLGCHALLMHRTTKLAASLELKSTGSTFDTLALRTQLPRDAMSEMDPDAQQEDDNVTRAMRLRPVEPRSFEGVLAELWTSVVGPVLDRLSLQKTTGRDRPRLWWCMTGELTFLPIHAAGEYCEASPVCTADYVVSSYIPTLSSLTKARDGWCAVPRTAVVGLLVCENLSSEGPARHLLNAAKEIRLVRDCFCSAQAQVLNTPSEHTSLSELRAMIDGTPAHILHLACHGIQDPDPLKSALLLQDGEFSIEDIMRLNLPHAVLAYLSACQTAKGDRNAPDQAVHLAASMLFCGFRSVIGTMWPMHDEDGPVLARRLYEILFEKELLDLDDIPYALDEAVQALRRASVPAQRWAPFMHLGG